MTTKKMAEGQVDIVEQVLKAHSWERDDIRRARKVLEALWGSARLSRVAKALKVVLDSTELYEIFKALQTARTIEALQIALRECAWPGEKIRAALGAICAPDEVLLPPPYENDGSPSKELQDLMDRIEDEDRPGVSDAKRLTRTAALEMWKLVAERPEDPEAIAWAAFTAKRILHADDYPAAVRAGQIVRATALAGNKDKNYEKRRALMRVDEQAEVLQAFENLDAAVPPKPTKRYRPRATLKEISKLPEFKGYGRERLRSAVHKLRKPR
jgi:hypothetical protein